MSRYTKETVHQRRSKKVYSVVRNSADICIPGGNTSLRSLPGYGRQWQKHSRNKAYVVRRTLIFVWMNGGEKLTFLPLSLFLLLIAFFVFFAAFAILLFPPFIFCHSSSKMVLRRNGLSLSLSLSLCLQALENVFPGFCICCCLLLLFRHGNSFVHGCRQAPKRQEKWVSYIRFPKKSLSFFENKNMRDMLSEKSVWRCGFNMFWWWWSVRILCRSWIRFRPTWNCFNSLQLLLVRRIYRSPLHFIQQRRVRMTYVTSAVKQIYIGSLYTSIPERARIETILI